MLVVERYRCRVMLVMALLGRFVHGVMLMSSPIGDSVAE
jgi:hypothetical protein